MCVDASALKVEEAPGASVLFSLKPILAEMEGRRYVGPVLPVTLADLLTGKHAAGGSGGGSGGGRDGGPSNGGGSGGSDREPRNSRMGAARGDARVQVRYDVHLTALYLWDGENLTNLLVGTVLPSLHVHALCKN